MFMKISKYNMPQGVLVTQQAGVHGVYSSFSLLWHLLPLSYSLWDICKEKHVRYHQ